jgi:hypothetical protein
MASTPGSIGPELDVVKVYCDAVEQADGVQTNGTMAEIALGSQLIAVLTRDIRRSIEFQGPLTQTFQT